jgi:DNA-binding NarL/FixJ family response regulator
VLWGALVNKIRVVLANHPMMIPDAIRQLVSEQEDMELVGDLRGPMEILQETGRTKTDAVILGQEGSEEPGLCSQLLAVYPDLTILSVTSDLTSVFTQQLCSRRERVVTGEPLDIVRTMRKAVRQRASWIKYDDRRMLTMYEEMLEC